MTILANIAWAANPTSGAATPGSTGLDTMTGGTHVGATAVDLPPGSTANGFVRGVADAALTFRVDATTVPFNGGETHHWIRFWARANRNSTALAADNSFGYLHTLVNAGTKIRHELRVRNGTSADGLAHNLTEFVAGGTLEGLGQAMAALNEASISFNRWTQFVVHMFNDAGAAVYELIQNGVVVARLTAWDSVTELAAAISTQWTIILPAIAGITWDLGAPIDSWKGTDITVRRLTTVVPTLDRCPVRWGMDWVNSAQGGSFTYAGVPVLTTAFYAAGGTNPKRRIATLTGAGTGAFTSIDNVGTPNYNEYGDAFFVFPMWYFPAGATGYFELQTVGGATLKRITYDGTNILEGATVLAACAAANRQSVTIYLNSDKSARWGTTDLTKDHGATLTQNHFSGRLTDWTPQDVGKVVISVTVSGTPCQVDGFFSGAWHSIAGMDSLSHAPVNGMVPICAGATHQAERMSRCIGSHLVPDSPWPFRSLGIPHEPILVIVGRTGRTRTQHDLYIKPGLENVRAAHQFGVDGGSINDFAGVTTAALRDDQVRDLMRELREHVGRCCASRCKITVFTMIRREVAPFPFGAAGSFQNQGIDLYNIGARQIAQEFASTGLVFLADTAGYIADHTTVLAGGDGTHPTNAGDDAMILVSMTYRRQMLPTPHQLGVGGLGIYRNG